MTEYLQGLGSLLRVNESPIPCALILGDWQIPLGVVQYVGGGFIYLHAPAVAAWFYGWSDDPYLFRYVGIVAYLIDGWLIYILARRFWGWTTAWWAAVLWLTTPNLFFIAIADLQWEIEPAGFAMVGLVLLLAALEKQRVLIFLIGCGLVGFTATTRVDAFLLLILCTAVYLTLVRPRAVIEPARTMLRRRLWIAPAGLVAMAAGALPLILYNMNCPSMRFSPFVQNVVLGYTFGVDTPFGLRFWIRLKQYFAVNVLHQMPFLEVQTPNYAFAIAFVAALALVIRSIPRHGITFPLLSLILIIPLSMLSTGVLRPEHMIPFQVLTTLLVAKGLSFDPPKGGEVVGSGSAVWIRRGLLIVALCGNLIVQVIDWREWQNQPRNRDTILNQSAPEELERYLRKFGPDDEVYFTNIGLHAYQTYMTRYEKVTYDITMWEGEPAFRAKIKEILEQTGNRRVFVNVAFDRDGGRFTLTRTRILLEVLDSLGIPYHRETLSTPRRQDLYDVVIVSAGVGIP